MFSLADGFVAKYTSNGQIISVQQISGSMNEDTWGIVLDKAGNGFIAGYYDSTDLSLGQFLLPSAPNQNGFVAKFETTVPPRLAARSTGASTAELSWCALAEGFYVESSSSLQSDANWRSNTLPVERIGTTNRVIIDTSSERSFHRLKRP